MRGLPRKGKQMNQAIRTKTPQQAIDDFATRDVQGLALLNAGLVRAVRFHFGKDAPLTVDDFMSLSHVVMMLLMNLMTGPVKANMSKAMLAVTVMHAVKDGVFKEDEIDALARMMRGEHISVGLGDPERFTGYNKFMESIKRYTKD